MVIAVFFNSHPDTSNNLLQEKYLINIISMRYNLKTISQILLGIKKKKLYNSTYSTAVLS